MRFLIRLGVLALAAFGAKALYDKYGGRVGDLTEAARDFKERTATAGSSAADRVTRATSDAKDTVGDAVSELGAVADEVISAVSDARTEVSAAAKDATDSAVQQVAS